MDRQEENDDDKANDSELTRVSQPRPTTSRNTKYVWLKWVGIVLVVLAGGAVTGVFTGQYSLMQQLKERPLQLTAARPASSVATPSPQSTPDSRTSSGITGSGRTPQATPAPDEPHEALFSPTSTPTPQSTKGVATPTPVAKQPAKKPKVDDDVSIFHLGPRGGCYSFTESGRKVYVDRGLCKR